MRGEFLEDIEEKKSFAIVIIKSAINNMKSPDQIIGAIWGITDCIKYTI